MYQPNSGGDYCRINMAPGMGGKALVLGGGGVTGLAWEIGLLAGLQEAGVDLMTADVVIGTSAGSVVGTQILSGVPLEELYARQLRDPTGEIASRMGVGVLLRFLAPMLLPGDEQKARARIGRAALRAHTMPEAQRTSVIASRLASHDWPARDLRITSVVADTGEFVVFTRDSGVEIVDAVAASCAVPLVYPPVTINGRRYVDGGVRSVANADVAPDFDPVVVLVPIALSLRRSQRIENQVMGRRSAVVTADAQARKAMGRQALDPAKRAAAARAGRAQAESVARRVAEVWTTVGP